MTRTRNTLTVNDRKNLRNQCRMGIALSVLLFVFVGIIGITIYESSVDLNPDSLNTKMAITILGGALAFSIILNFLINYKFYIDLRNNEKIQITKTLDSKEKSIDSAASRNTSFVKGHLNRYEFDVDNVKFMVDEKLFESCAEGDKLDFNYAPKSEYLLGIEKSKS